MQKSVGPGPDIPMFEVELWYSLAECDLQQVT